MVSRTKKYAAIVAIVIAIIILGIYDFLFSLIVLRMIFTIAIIGSLVALWKVSKLPTKEETNPD